MSLTKEEVIDLATQGTSIFINSTTYRAEDIVEIAKAMQSGATLSINTYAVGNAGGYTSYQVNKIKAAIPTGVVFIIYV